MYTRKSKVNFPTRNFNGSSTAIDNIFINLSRNFTTNPNINRLSDHDILLKVKNVTAPIQGFTSCYVRHINSFTIDEFQSNLTTESWEEIFEGSDINGIFNNFLNIYLKNFLCMFH